MFTYFLADDQYLYSTKFGFNTKKEFEQWLRERLNNRFYDFFIVKNNQLKSIGFVYNYDLSLIDGHCKLVVYIIDEYRKTGIGGFVATKFMKYLFAKYPIRKVYSTIYDYNQESLQSHIAAGFIEEGSISDYRYYHGTYHRIHYFSMNRKTFESTLGKLVK
ncbi:MAG: GNAT family N-acetyltransferase [Erysipelotrichaceae bacterium]|nr:GNAT family N-acetyltransferase [Erysipelotrichaceae bacterium]